MIRTNKNHNPFSGRRKEPRIVVNNKITITKIDCLRGKIRLPGWVRENKIYEEWMRQCAAASRTLLLLCFVSHLCQTSSNVNRPRPPTRSDHTPHWRRRVRHDRLHYTPATRLDQDAIAAIGLQGAAIRPKVTVLVSVQGEKK